MSNDGINANRQVSDAKGAPVILYNLPPAKLRLADKRGYAGSVRDAPAERELNASVVTRASS